DRHAVPGSLVAVLKMQPLAVGPVTEDNRIAAVLDGAEHVATQHEAIVHRNRHVPVDAYAVADFAHLTVARGPLAFRISFWARSSLRNERQQNIGLPIRPGVQRDVAAEHSGRAVARIVMGERADAGPDLAERLNARPRLTRINVIGASHGQRKAIAF